VWQKHDKLWFFKFGLPLTKRKTVWCGMLKFVIQMDVLVIEMIVLVIQNDDTEKSASDAYNIH